MPRFEMMVLGYIFYFFASDGNEPIHVHASKKRQQKDATKFWITTDSVELARDSGTVEAKDMKNVLAFLRANHAELVSGWMAYFGKGKSKR